MSGVPVKVNPPSPALLVRLEVADLGRPNVIRGFLLLQGIEAAASGAEPQTLR